jgi:hypothetical protein
MLDFQQEDEKEGFTSQNDPLSLRCCGGRIDEARCQARWRAAKQTTGPRRRSPIFANINYYSIRRVAQQ